MANFISNIISSGCKFGIFSWISTLNNQKRTHNA
ncbi:pyridoxine 5'-phosphate synthase, partial [Bacteroides ovatus]